MTANPWERLRAASLRLVRDVGKLIRPLHDNALRRSTMLSVDEMQAALAACPAAPPPPDPERERAAKALLRVIDCAAEVEVIAEIEEAEARAAVALMRSAPAPTPADPAPPSDWRERFNTAMESVDPSRAMAVAILIIRDGLAALEDQVRAMVREAGR